MFFPGRTVDVRAVWSVCSMPEGPCTSVFAIKNRFVLQVVAFGISYSAVVSWTSKVCVLQSVDQSIALLCAQGGMTWTQFKEEYLRKYYLPVSFTVGTLTFGIKTASENFSLQDDVSQVDLTRPLFDGP